MLHTNKYTRFQNALMVLRDAREHLTDDDIPAYEKAARSDLLDLCGDIYVETEHDE